MIEELKAKMAERIVQAKFDIRPQCLPGMMAQMALRANRKGWILCGKTGCGKTKAAEWCKWAANNGKMRIEGVQMVSAMEICRKIAELMQANAWSGQNMLEVFGLTNGPWNNEHSHDMIVDDLGAEPRRTIVFGQEVFPMEEFIMKRYVEFPAAKTYFTTNLSLNELRERYGERIFSRICEMCVIIPVEGEDYRTQK